MVPVVPCITGEGVVVELKRGLCIQYSRCMKYGLIAGR